MKLNPTQLRYMTNEEFRVLVATEMGSRNHEIVPTTLIAHIAQLKHGGIQKILNNLEKLKLVAREVNGKYPGFRLTYGGYDFLALRTMSKRESIHSVGNQIGVGKESDIYLVADVHGNQRVLKIHRLGRVSFKTIKSNRDYLRNKHTSSWKYMARLAATKEFAFLKVLHQNGFPVPEPIDHNRHCIVMGLVDGFPLYQIQELEDPGSLYSKLMDLIVRLASSGLIHGDFNEFNLLVSASNDPILIDFPQMVSTNHRNAEFYFNRDVQCIREFFRKRFNYSSKLYPKLSIDVETGVRLDVQVAASGFSKRDQDTLQKLEEQLLQTTSATSTNSDAESCSDDEESCDEYDVDSVALNNSTSLESEEIHETLEDQMHQMNLRDASRDVSSDDDQEQSETLFENDNSRYRPHRDTRDNSVVHAPSIDSDKIRKIVSKSLKKSKQGTSGSGNLNKDRKKRQAKDTAKGGASGFWA